jgi:hypothetical protein
MIALKSGERTFGHLRAPHQFQAGDQTDLIRQERIEFGEAYDIGIVYAGGLERLDIARRSPRAYRAATLSMKATDRREILLRGAVIGRIGQRRYCRVPGYAIRIMLGEHLVAIQPGDTRPRGLRAQSADHAPVVLRSKHRVFGGLCHGPSPLRAATRRLPPGRFP